MGKVKKNYEYYLGKIEEGCVFDDPGILSIKDRKGNSIAMEMAANGHEFTSVRLLNACNNKKEITVAGISVSAGGALPTCKEVLLFNTGKNVPVLKQYWLSNRGEVNSTMSDIDTVYRAILTSYLTGDVINHDSYSDVSNGGVIYKALLLSNKRYSSLFNEMVKYERGLDLSTLIRLHKDGYNALKGNVNIGVTIDSKLPEVPDSMQDDLFNAICEINVLDYIYDVNSAWLCTHHISTPILAAMLDNYYDYIHCNYGNYQTIEDEDVLGEEDKAVIAMLITLPKEWHCRYNSKDDAFILEYVFDICGTYPEGMCSHDSLLTEIGGRQITYMDIFAKQQGLLTGKDIQGS